jgi:hypothetical protein
MLMACPECRGRVSSSAIRCPHCGCSFSEDNPVSSREPDWTDNCAVWILLGIVLLALWMAFISNPRAVWDFLGWFPRR